MKEKLYNDIAANIADIKNRVKIAAESVGRDPNEIEIMAVTKTIPAEVVNIALDNGITLLGENRAQELTQKVDFYNKDKAAIHFIGYLQTNKVKQIIDYVSLIQSLDRLSLAKEINRQAAKRNIIMDILVQVNIGKEKTKAGIMPENMVDFMSMLKDYTHIRVRGLMAIPPICEDEDVLNDYFVLLRQLFVDMKAIIGDNKGIDILSMGMSGDFESAIRNGSTLIRVGTAIFGERP